ncbi:MAG: NAD(P)/FAD-dependent oxidoreductase [Acidobacteria bacterium]|nr:NAD(P)/FAD-dependent oxidoreductase [Acidobacteriota bacterium]
MATKPSADSTPPVIILGAGPAGLTAAYELRKNDIRSVVLEKDNTVGGISRTAEYKGYLFDIGGHRFFTKVTIVRKMWQEVLGADLLSRPRLSRIFYRRKFFHYPLQPMNALFGLGIFESAHCGLSYLWARVVPIRPEDNFEAWVSNRFGRRLFRIFFESYTEKVWGMSCKKIRAEWAAQRIKGLSLLSLVKNALFAPKSSTAIKTLIHEFQYPRRGPGMMWQRTRDIVEAAGSTVELNTAVEKIFWEPGRVTGVYAGGHRYSGEYFISSLPIRELIQKLDPPAPPRLLRAAEDFNYRDFLTVALIVRSPELFPDNWIYIHEPGVKVGRIQNFKNWSPEMVPDPATSCLGLEYFCFEGDGLWNTPDADLVALGRKELAELGLARAEDIVDGAVVRMAKAYPVYDDVYQRGIDAICAFLAEVPNLQLVGRNGMHRYNNQDHSMLTAILAARNIVHEMRGAGPHYDLWKVNADEDYHEGAANDGDDDFSGLESTQPLVPAPLSK